MGTGSGDPKTWIFHLRQGVTFHDGTPFDADAVMWNLDRFWKQDSPQSIRPAPVWCAAAPRWSPATARSTIARWRSAPAAPRPTSPIWRSTS
ncbi:ABC transporter substrate-binding protein [Siccirubricoccus deserti]